MSAGRPYGRGARVWIPDCVHVWRAAEITRGYEEGDSVLHLRLEDGSTLVYPLESHLPPLCNPECLRGKDDLVALSHLHEPAVLHSLRVRFLEANAIYTYCGIVLVAINPYAPLPIYEEEVIDAYSGREMGDMDPHIFALAEEAYRQMVRFGRNQSIIISGESGAGKTASAKYALRYFTTVGGGLDDSSMEEKVLASSPLMEAFGNAKTTRNDNSSRFGKYLEIGFSQGRVTGAAIRTYLLERSRVTFQAKAERNYHIFYQLCAAAALPELQGLGLRGAETFHYTRQGRCSVGSEDAADLDSTRHAFSLLGVPEAEQLELFAVLAAILHLGNVTIRGRDRHGDSCFVEPDDASLGLLCALLGVEEAQVTRWLCHRKLVTAGETLVKPLSRQQALDCRDALAKHMYGQVFRWMASRVNRALRSPEGHQTSIGILDIYGFEVFELNSFEQLCINYANEKLQQLFNLHVFKLEQEEYVAEEIPWVFIDFCDNQPCLELIEGRLGILDLLNEESKMPQGSDGSWAQKLYQTHLASTHFQKPKRPTDAFVVCHFAGKVEYQCHGFVEKNRDSVPEELVGLLRASKSPLLAELFLEDGDVPASRRSGGARGGRLSRRSLPGGQKSKKSLSSQFRASLQRLTETLGSTTPHYVRCIKPNDSKLPFVFDSRRVVEQLRACGVLETIRISAAGYPSRWTYQEFFARYRALVSREELEGVDMKQSCSRVLERLLQDPSKYRCGRSKVFFRAGQVAFLEELRGRRLRAACTLLQQHLRGWLARRRFQRARAAALCLQRHARGMLARRLAVRLRRSRAAVVLQKNVRMVLARRRFLHARRAAVTIQAFARGMFARRLYREMVRHRKAVVLQAAVRGWLARRRYARLRGAVLHLQCCYRRARARRELQRRRAEARSEHYKQLHKGMEIKVMQLQCRLDEQAQEKQQLAEQLSALNAAHAEEVQRLQDEMRRLREEVEHSARVQRLQEQPAELERPSAESHLAQEVQELRQRLAEVEAVNLHLGKERDALIQRSLEQSQDLEEQQQRAVQESRGLQQELEEQRARYQSLVKEYSRLEQGYENLRDEVAFHRQSTLRRSPSTESFLGSESSCLSSVSTAPSWDGSDLQAEGSEERWSLVPEGTQPLGDAVPGRGVGQEPLDRMYLLLLGQLNAVTTELARTREELRRSKASSEHEERRPLDFLKRRNLAEMLGLGRSPEKAAGEEDLKQAYDAMQAANRLLASQLQEQRQHHEEEVEGLHLDIRSLQQLSQQQAALIQELQQRQGREEPQHQLVRLKEENWELTQKLEKQGRNVLRLQKQLRAHVKQIQAFTAMKAATPAPEPAGSSGVPSQAQAMLVWRSEDEGRIIKAIITDHRPQSGPGALPELPAFILFLCIRHADHCHDEQRVNSLLEAAIGAIKRVMKKHSDDFDTVALWLANTHRLLNCLRQYGRDQSCSQGNTARQDQHRLCHVDPQGACRSLDALAVQLYQQLIRTAEKRLKPMIVAAMLESEAIQGLSSSLPPTHPRRSVPPPAHTLPELLHQLCSFCTALELQGLCPAVGQQVLRQLLFLISGTTLNYLLLRRDVCSWSRGIQLRYNISQLEQGLRARGLQQSGAREELEPLVQAAQLLQVKKATEEDAAAICSLCTLLSPQQVVKILRAYSPAAGLEERVSPGFISSVERRLQEQQAEGTGQLLVDTSHIFPVQLPFVPSPVHLDELRIPDTVDLSFLVHL